MKARLDMIGQFCYRFVTKFSKIFVTNVKKQVFEALNKVGNKNQ